ncbi:hypothetical protein [Rhodococcus erythropolis]|nr:hypothetical protein [Rhodococcus erythropolis]MCW2301589.1 hypothetical protein [Rhodococcus erythropolis]
MPTRTIMSLKSLARRYQDLTAEIDVLKADLKQLAFQINDDGNWNRHRRTTIDHRRRKHRSTEVGSVFCSTLRDKPYFGFQWQDHSSPAGSRRRPACKLCPPSNRPHSMTYDQRTRDYIQRKLQEGKGTEEIVRCLKRAIA